MSHSSYDRGVWLHRYEILGYTLATSVSDATRTREHKWGREAKQYITGSNIRIQIAWS